MRTVVPSTPQLAETYLENMLVYEEIAELEARLEQEGVYLQEEIKTEQSSR